MIAGIDEAGRGPVIGCMVICGISFKEEAISKLIDLGVVDSKKLSAKKRRYLFQKIIDLAEDYSILEISPQIIDRYVFEKKLNVLELEKFIEIINSLKADIFYVDCPDVNPKRFLKNIQNHLKQNKKIICEHRADLEYPAVSAASILAKVRRDSIIEDYKKKYGDIGSGYTSDPITITFLKKYYAKNRRFLSIVRKSWSTLSKIKKEINQQKLDNFI